MNTNFNNDFWMMAMVADVVTRRTNKAIERTNQLLEKIRKQGLSPAERAAEDAARAAVKAAQERRAAQEMAIFKVGMVVVAVLIAICLFVSQWN
jgi:CHASE3 domain sensor protein